MQEGNVLKVTVDGLKGQIIMMKDTITFWHKYIAY